MLGHASISITLDIYSHVLPDMQHDAAEAMGITLYARAENPTNCYQEASETQKRLQAQQLETASNQPLLGAGGTGIEPATCGFGDPMLQFALLRHMSPRRDFSAHNVCQMS